MQPRRSIGGLARPGRGDVDLEKLQDSFMRSTEMPSAKVTRSKVRSSTFRFAFENSKVFSSFSRDVAIATRSKQSHGNKPAVICDGPQERDAARATLLLIACPPVLGLACQLPCSVQVLYLFYTADQILATGLSGFDRSKPMDRVAMSFCAPNLAVWVCTSDYGYARSTVLKV